jgi:hypothetical protein
LLKGKGSDSGFGGFFYPITQVWLLAAGIKKGVNASLRNCRLIAVKGVTGKSHHLAGAGHVAKLGGQIQQADLVFNYVLRNTAHGVTPWRLRAGFIKIRTSIKPGNPTLWQGPTVRSSLNYYKLGETRCALSERARDFYQSSLKSDCNTWSVAVLLSGCRHLAVNSKGVRSLNALCGRHSL